MWTKGDIVASAFTELGIAVYIYDLLPEQVNACLVRLDIMMASWDAAGLRLGWPIPDSPSASSLTEKLNIPIGAINAIITNLAVQMAPSYGKAVPPETKISAASSFENIFNLYTVPPMPLQMQPTLPRGAGYKPLQSGGYSPFVNPPQPSLDAGGDGAINFWGTTDANN